MSTREEIERDAEEVRLGDLSDLEEWDKEFCGWCLVKTNLLVEMAESLYLCEGCQAVYNTENSKSEVGDETKEASDG